MELPKNIKAILFDCDNTLVMSEVRAFEGCAMLTNEICEKYGVKLEEPFDGASLLENFVGMNFRGMMEKLQTDYGFKMLPKDTERYVLKEMYVVIDKLRDELDECEGVTKQLEALDALNKPITEQRQKELDAFSKSDISALQEKLTQFNKDVSEADLLYELRKPENWKLEAAHRFNTEVARYEKQEAEKAEKQEAAVETDEDAVPEQYQEKAYVLPTKLTASTPLLLVVVSSSAKARVEVSVEKGKMLPFFDTRIFSAATSLPKPTSKPNPAIYKFAMESFGLRPEECIAVEDSVSGATAGVSAGIPTIGYVWPYSTEKPDRSEEMAVTLTKLTHYETKQPASVTNIMRHWREFPERLREIDEAAGKA